MKILSLMLKKPMIDDTTKGSGGWMDAYVQDFSCMSSYHLVVCYSGKKNTFRGTEENGVAYYEFKGWHAGRRNAIVYEYFVTILKREQPDVIHIWGTEYVSSYDMWLAACHVGMENRVLVSIQGLVGVYARVFDGGVPYRIAHEISISNRFRNSGIKFKKDEFTLRGKYEKKLLSDVKWVAGRTDWDKAFFYINNSKGQYVNIGESLRKEFYDGRWEYEKCRPYSIYFTQCSVPLKGFHLLLEAVKLIKGKYPNVRVVVSGKLRSHKDNAWNVRLGSGNYERYLWRLICESELVNNVEFVGKLDANQVKRELLRSNVFISSSAIENSSNAIGEAMLLGVPIIASYVGGTPSIIRHKSEGLLFPYGEVEILAHYIDLVFSSPNEAKARADKALIHAKESYSWEKNRSTLIDTYCKIANTEQ